MSRGENSSRTTILIERVVGVSAFAQIVAVVITQVAVNAEPGVALGYVGISVSTAGLIVALLIFFRQKRDSQASELRILDSVNKRAQQEASEDEAPDGDDAYEAETAVLERLGQNVGGGVKRLQRDDIPLKLIHDVVLGWEKAGVQGDWSLSAVHSALRKHGKGNHAWWLITRDPESEKDRVFKVSRGGQGVRDVTVTEVN